MNMVRDSGRSSVKRLAVTQTSSPRSPRELRHGPARKGSGVEGGEPGRSAPSRVGFHVASPDASGVAVTTNDDLSSEGSERASITPNES